MKISESLKINNKLIRTRSFEMAGQFLRVRIPLVLEMEEINERVKNVEWESKFKKLAEPFLEQKETIETDDVSIKFIDDDIFVNDNSVKEMAKLTAQTHARILEMFKLLLPMDNEQDFSSLTYEEIEQEFPFSIQLEITKKISEVISPGYEEIRKNL